MRYTPKELKDNPNVSSTSPVKELFTLLAGILVIILTIYIVLGFMVNIIAPRLPEKIEQDLGKLYTRIYRDKKTEPALEKEIQNLLNNLVAEMPPSKKAYKVHLIEDAYVNAVALPGDNIVIFSGLLKEIESENELSFVLAHELGHFTHRDHLKAMGRQLVLFVFSSLLLGQDSHVSNFLANSLTKVEMRFSQTQEKNADLFALELLNETYGHIGGIIEFIERIRDKEKLPQFTYLFATHPHPEIRIGMVYEKMQQEGYLIKETIPLVNAFKNIVD